MKDSTAFLKKLATPGVKVTQINNPGQNKEEIEGNYFRVSVGLSSGSYFVGTLVKQNNSLIVEYLGQ